jgi:thioesterase domain-containing protein
MRGSVTPVNSEMTVPQRTSTDEARAALWTGILGAAKQIGKRGPLPAPQRPPVIQLKTGTAETSVYFISAGLPEYQIAQLIGSERSIFGVEIPWPSAWRNAAAENTPHALPTMEQLVAPYVAALRLHARAAPCVLVGYSFSGLMAFEAAHQINEQGGKVDMVILLDAPAIYPASHLVAWRKIIKVWTQAFSRGSTDKSSQSIAASLENSWSIIHWLAEKKIKGFRRRFLPASAKDPGKLTTKLDDTGVPLHWALIERLYAIAVKSYRLRPVGCRGVLFRAEESDESPAGTIDDRLGWSDLFNEGLEIVQVTGDHLAMMQEQQHKETLAREMSKLLDRPRAKPVA